MKVIAAFFLISVTLFSCSEGKKKAKEVERYKCKYDTYAHQLLHAEENVLFQYYNRQEEMYDREYALLDDIIDSSIVALTPIINQNLPEEEKALKVFDLIDSTLTSFNFIVCVYTSFIHEGLYPKKLPEFDSITCIIEWTDERRAHYELNKDSKFHRMDCDISSYIYLSIGEIMSLPIKMVNVPNHAFVRWEFENGEYVNWDTNSAKSFLDEEYKEGNLNCCEVKLTDEEIENCSFLKSWDASEIKASQHLIIAFLYSQLESYKEAIRHYEKALQLQPNLPLAMNNISSLLLSKPELKSKKNAEKAFALSAKVDSLLPSKLFYKGTYALAFAENGQYEEAMKRNEELIELQPDNIYPMNNLSWLLLTTKELKSEANYKRAYELSSLVDSIAPTDTSSKSTFSCACAAIGDFEKAIEIERQMVQSNHRIRAYERGKTCLDIDEK
jgi:tetratricopeptide (TPR) repeat protein